MGDKMILVLVGRYPQFVEWLRQTKTPASQARYVREEQHYLGFYDREYVFVGEYWKNPLYQNQEFGRYCLAHGLWCRSQPSGVPTFKNEYD